MLYREHRHQTRGHLTQQTRQTGRHDGHGAPRPTPRRPTPTRPTQMERWTQMTWMDTGDTGTGTDTGGTGWLRRQCAGHMGLIGVQYRALVYKWGSQAGEGPRGPGAGAAVWHRHDRVPWVADAGSAASSVAPPGRRPARPRPDNDRGPWSGRPPAWRGCSEMGDSGMRVLGARGDGIPDAGAGRGWRWRIADANACGCMWQRSADRLSVREPAARPVGQAHPACAALPHGTATSPHTPRGRDPHLSTSEGGGLRASRGRCWPREWRGLLHAPRAHALRAT